MALITQDITAAKAALLADDIIGLPTETVYGLAGNIYSEKAIHRIYEVKKRPAFNPLIVHLKSVHDLEQVAVEVPELAYQLAEKFWPGPLTLLLKKHSRVPDWITSGKPTVAVRVPNHPLALSLLNQLDFPLAAPSANPFSTISPTTAEHVKQYFDGDISLILDGGACQRGIESTIIGFEGDAPVLYRLGSLATEQLERYTGPLKTLTKNDTSPEAPGMLSKHYSPNTRLLLTNDLVSAVQRHKGIRIGLLTFGSIEKPGDVSYVECLSVLANVEDAAAELYAALHRLDKADLDLIIAERLPDTGLGRSINDRLERAAQF